MFRHLLCSLAFLSVGCTITIQTPEVNPDFLSKVSNSESLDTPKRTANSTEETISLAGVTDIRIAAPLKVTVKEDAAAEAILKVPAEIRERLQIQTQGRGFALTVKDDFCIQSEASGFGSNSTVIINGTVRTDCFTTDTELSLEISSTLLEELTLSHAVEVTLNNLDEADFVLRTLGASSVEFRNMRDIEDLRIDISGASSISATGNTPVLDSLQIETSGASKVDLANVLAKQVTVDISGVSQVSVQSEQPVSGRVTGVSSLTLSGNPNHRVQTSGVSHVGYR